MEAEHNGSSFLQHEPCPSCGSKDNLARYDDNHGFCFGCGYHEKGDGEVCESTPKINSSLISGEFKSLLKRKISEDICRKYSYMVGEYKGSLVQIAPYRDSKGLVAQKLRFPNKDFIWIGNKKEVTNTLWGQHLWNGGRRVVVTEGEIDAMSIAQTHGGKWATVSISSGAKAAKKDIAAALEWLESFDEVVLCFDMDDAGQSAAQECALLLSPGKAKIAHLPLKDASEMLQAGREDELNTSLWQAKTFRPDGIVSGNDTWDLVIAEDAASSIQYPWEGLNDKTYGLRVGEIVTLCSGSGVGKSQVCREIASDLIRRGETVGYIALEENVKRSIRGLLSIFLNKPIHLPEAREGLGEGAIKKEWDVIKDRCYFYDHWGSIESDNLLNKIRYMARGCGCRWIVLDHISIMVSGLGDGDERRMIDNAMTQLRSLVEELGIGLILVSHLKRPSGVGHEEGGQTSLSQLRGSAAIGQLSDIVIGLERNQQCDEFPDRTVMRVLKNRYTGDNGIAGSLDYSKETGRLSEVQDNPFKDGESDY
jgi:twinkle protein